jgi:inorganic triphosphatase YgiF
MREIEAKFIIRRPEQVAKALRVLSANGFSVKDCGTKLHVDRYFDTEDWSILAAAWACRIRRRNGEAKLTLKSLHGPDGSVFVREEISQPIPDEDPELSFSLPLGHVRDELAGNVGNMPVAELFRVTSERTVYEIARTGPEPVQIELDLDRSRIEAEKRTEKAAGILNFTELELELVSGDTADIDTISTLLRDEAGLLPAKYSKFERGLQAAGLEIDSILEQPQATTLVEDDPVLTLVYQYLAEQSQIIRRQHPRALEGIDPEGVHKMRVASRRLRTILKAFRDVLGDAVVAHFNAELRWLAQNLGRARDADVTERGAKESRAGDADHYVHFLRQQTITAYEHLADVLESERCAMLEDELAQIIAAGPPGDMQEQFGKLSIAASADQLIHAARNKLLAHGDAIEADSPARQLHKLRIETKRFRYLLDFFSTVQADKWRDATEAVKRIQDVLGEHQDAVTAQAHLADYSASLPNDASGREWLNTAARLMQVEAERIDTCRQQFATAWSHFRSVRA